MIFDIQRYAIHDGRGIRTLIFFKGCPLRCKWCDNPESQSIDYNIMWNKTLCIGCGECAEISQNGEIEFNNLYPKIHRDLIKNYEKFRDVCPTGALSIIGKEMSTCEIITEVKKDLLFYQKSCGGVTISGGEPFIQPQFLNKLLIELKNLKVNIAIETTLYTKWTYIEKVVPLVDTFLIDIKHVDERKFKKYTGGNLRIILKNIQRLVPIAKEVVGRIPIIPDFNTTNKEMKEILDYIVNQKRIKNINLIPYHTLGVGKYELLGREYLFHPSKSITNKMLTEFCQMARKNGLNCTIGG